MGTALRYRCLQPFLGEHGSLGCSCHCSYSNLSVEIQLCSLFTPDSNLEVDLWVAPSGCSVQVMGLVLTAVGFRWEPRVQGIHERLITCPFGQGPVQSESGRASRRR